MLVGDFMTPNPITVRPDSDYLAAIALMRAGRFRHLPVIDEQGRPVGIVTGGDLGSVRSTGRLKQQAFQSDGVLIRVHEVMKHPVITTTPEHPLEEAALQMVEHGIGCLPVVEDERLVGIITGADIFDTFIEILGGGSRTMRLCVQVDNTPGQLAILTGKIAEVGGNILSIASYPADRPSCINLALRIDAITLAVLQAAIDVLPGVAITNIWHQSE
ncbi:MAG: CBS domain-containing protein [Anaerolineae bacterium]|nr:CBS domain-containing protein [Anaerolineae bacterium]